MAVALPRRVAVPDDGRLGRPNPPGFAQLFFELPLLLRTKLCDGPRSDRGFTYRGNPRLARNAVAPLPVSFMMFMISFLSTIIRISFFDISLFNMLYRYSICRKCASSPTIACKIATTGTNTHNPGIEWYRSYFSHWFPHRDHASQVLSCSFKNAAPICPGAESGPNQNSSSAEPIPSTSQGCITAKLEFHTGYQPGNRQALGLATPYPASPTPPPATSILPIQNMTTSGPQPVLVNVSSLKMGTYALILKRLNQDH